MTPITDAGMVFPITHESGEVENYLRYIIKPEYKSDYIRKVEIYTLTFNRKDEGELIGKLREKRSSKFF